MYKKFIKYSSLLACASVSSLSNAYAMDVDPPERNKGVPPKTLAQPFTENEWKVSFKSKHLKIESSNENTFVREIIIYSLEGKNSSCAKVFVQSPQFRKNAQEIANIHNTIAQQLASQKIVYDTELGGLTYIGTFMDEKTPAKFLAVFYNNKLIPDFAIDRIIKHIGIEDFRMNTESMIACINEQMTEESTAADFKRIALDELIKIKDPVRRAEITWGLVQNLNDSENFDRHLVIDLCEQINNPNLPFFKEAKQFGGNLAYTDDSLGKVSIEQRYKKPIIDLLKTSDSQGSKPELNAFVKGFITNDVPSPEFPDALKELKNLTVSAEPIYELLNIIRLQELKLKILQNQNQ